MKINTIYNGHEIETINDGSTMRMVIPYTAEKTFLEIQFEREKKDEEEYLLFPASAYNGNRFKCLYRPYPPMFRADEAKIDMPVTVTHTVARLCEDGSGKIAVTSGDLSVPCVGIYDRKHETGTLLFTKQQEKGKNIGYTYENGVVSVVIPHRRNDAFPFCQQKDAGIRFTAGEEIVFEYKLFTFSCDSLQKFMRTFLEKRKCMGLSDEYSEKLSAEQIWRIMEEKFNSKNYCDALDTYAVGAYEDCGDDLYSRKFQVWQPGWVGGAISSYPLMKCGSWKSYERGLRTLEFLFSTQKSSGFFMGVVDDRRVEYGDAFGTSGAEDWHLVRKSADVLFFLFKHFEVIEEKGETVPEAFLLGTRKLADGFVRLWKQYGQFGQFVSHDTGRIAVGGSSSGAIAPAGLAEAGMYFGNKEYLEIARESGEYYYRLFLKDGCTTGGPGEILQCPDSESAFGLLESMVVLYEATKEKKWLTYAEDVAAYCSTWVVAYNYVFPENSEFFRLGIKSVGSVFANAQNKHSAPGICTLSGDSLVRLFRYTGDALYLELIKDIACNIFQYVSRADRPIRAKTEEGYKDMPSGYVNERVNMSDWENGRVGEVFYGSTWAETAVMLTIAELC